MQINDQVRLDESELVWSASRSGGPGGQNVNKVATKVTMRFDIGASTSLDDRQKARLFERLEGRLTNDGVLIVASQSERTQRANLEDARERMAAILRAALERPKKRRATRTPRSAKRRRLADKRHRSTVKRNRERPTGDG